MTDPLAAYHPELILVGAGAAALGALAGRLRPGIAMEAAAVAVAAWLTIAEHVEPIAAVAVAIAAIASAVRADGAAAGRTCRAITVDAVVAVAVLGLARTDATAAATLLVTATAAATVATLRSGAGRFAWAPAILLLAAAAATFGGAPDTEAAVVVGSAVALVALGSAVRDRLGPPASAVPVVVGWATPGLVAFVAVDSYRGRTGGLPAALVACAAVVLAAGLATRQPNPAPRRRIVATGAGAVAALVAARTIGLATAASPGAVVLAVALATTVLAVGWWAGAWRPVAEVSGGERRPSAHGRTRRA